MQAINVSLFQEDREVTKEQVKEDKIPVKELLECLAICIKN
jgi:hypothetical protein